jgi:hypothetical protein
MRRLRFALVCAVAAAVLAATASGGAPPAEVSASDYDRDNFDNSTSIDNKWFPLRPGTQLVFRGTTIEGKESIPHRVIFTVTDLTKEIDGVDNIVLWDRDYSSGELVEAEIAFFAQDDDGHVWQLGEYPEEYEEGKIIASPLWVHGLQRAKAGLTMRAVPKTGTSSYSLGWGPAVGFNDRAKVSKMGVKTCVPNACYKNVLRARRRKRARGMGRQERGHEGDARSREDQPARLEGHRAGSRRGSQARGERVRAEEDLRRDEAARGRLTGLDGQSGFSITGSSSAGADLVRTARAPGLVWRMRSGGRP